MSRVTSAAETTPITPSSAVISLSYLTLTLVHTAAPCSTATVSAASAAEAPTAASSDYPCVFPRMVMYTMEVMGPAWSGPPHQMSGILIRVFLIAVFSRLLPRVHFPRSNQRRRRPR